MVQHSSARLSRNNFDLIRLVLAAVVCLVHSYELSGFEPLAVLGQVLSSAIAVKAFFVVSGFLIVMSYERSSSLSSYLRKRVRRIYPAYFTVVMLCAVGLLLVSSKTMAGYFSLDWLKYVVANLTFLNFLHPELPGVFEGQRVVAVNGALWTLKIEAMFYLFVPLLVLLLRRVSPLLILVLAYCASVVYAQVCTAIALRTGSGLYAELGRQLPGQLCYFIAGTFLYYFLPMFERRLPYFLVFAVAVLVVNRVMPLPLLEPFALACVVVFLALFLYVGNFGKYGDFSYGFYILHFPIIQLLVFSGWFSDRPWWFLLSVLSLTLIGAVLMWHLVEKHFLLRGSHYLGAYASGSAISPMLRGKILGA